MLVCGLYIRREKGQSSLPAPVVGPGFLFLTSFNYLIHTHDAPRGVLQLAVRPNEVQSG